MNKLQVKLMRRTALTRRKDAQTLRDADPFGDRSDSEYMLELLALELLIKCLLHAHDQAFKVRKGHHYDDLFKLLPAQLQSDILEKAVEIAGPSPLTVDPTGLLNKLGKQFIELRYPHEKYSDLGSEEEYIAVGEAWTLLGADPDSADFRYYPDELRALLMALEEVTERYVA
ncbi:hypothetical protein [Burkholderia multivorans]|uniref:hypothetical protein n=1 Tax=Burkholderia multivorans TaxID=87883 RepID=UPI0012DFA834|nr:hypothetical protein [Burkholderia multivorans]MBU9339520.1 hypothetical protein [Burkholderia multivorans]MCA8139898.1 hypothetical protein [Burkholderia multivorans]MCO1366737.1 hypothetical protein [Burkholderia multivorans]MCO1376346.1 hypothetical protein [Burkholderia multivorans]QGR60833.1 hypothetical protein FOC27_11685 [Burkholderia multivorans]